MLPSSLCALISIINNFSFFHFYLKKLLSTNEKPIRQNNPSRDLLLPLTKNAIQSNIITLLRARFRIYIIYEQSTPHSLAENKKYQKETDVTATHSQSARLFNLHNKKKKFYKFFFYKIVLSLIRSNNYYYK